MDKTLALVILIGGILLVIYGISASNSVSSDISRVFTDAPTDKAIWMLVGGVVVSIVGLAGLMRGSKA